MERIADLTLNYTHCILFFKCNLRVNNKEHSAFSSFLHMCMRLNSMCFKRVFAALFGVTAQHPGSFPPLPSLFPLFFQCDGCLFPFPAWGLMAGLPGFASHGRHSLSKSWLPIVEAPGRLRHPTSTKQCSF